MAQDLYGLQHRLRSRVGCDSECCCSCVPQPPAHLPLDRRRMVDRMDFSDDCTVGLSAAQTEAPRDVGSRGRPEHEAELKLAINHKIPD